MTEESWAGMMQGDRQSGPVNSIASPCVRRCTLDEQDLCVGCGRLLAEILEWAAAPIPRKLEIRLAATFRLERRRFRL